MKIVDTTRVKGVVVVVVWHYCRQECWAYPQVRVSDLIVTLTPCKQRYALHLSVIALNESTSAFSVNKAGGAEASPS